MIYLLVAVGWLALAWVTFGPGFWPYAVIVSGLVAIRLSPRLRRMSG